MSYPILGHLGFKIICTGMFLFTAKYMHVATAQRDIKIGLLDKLVKNNCNNFNKSS
jgi:hypothetical protein